MESSTVSSLPQFICDFDGISNVNTETNETTYGKGLFAMFFTDEERFNVNISAYDYIIFKPSTIIKDSDFSTLYDDIFHRMKLIGGEFAFQVPEEQRADYLKNFEKCKTDESKKDFLLNFVMTLIQFELIRPKVNDFVKKYLEENKEYKYVRVFSN